MSSYPQYLERMRSYPMVHNPYDDLDKSVQGSGGIGDVYESLPIFQRGYGGGAGGVYTRSVYQRSKLGYGIGSFFSRIFSFAKPWLKQGLQHAIDIGSNVAKDALAGENLKSSLKTRIKERIPEKYSALVDKTIGSGKRKNRRISRAVKHGGEKKRRPRRGKKKSVKYSALKLIPT